MIRRAVVIVLLIVSCFAQGANYRVVPILETKQARVTVTIDNPAGTFQMPAWAPGDYQIFDYGTKIQTIVFYRGDTVTDSIYDGKGRWTIPDGADRVEYLVNESRGNFSPNLRITLDEMFVSGPGVLGWFEGHAHEKQYLTLSPQEGQSVGISLPPVKERENCFVANDYDRLIDSPFVVSKNLRIKEWTILGKKHVIAGYNKPEQVDLDAYAVVCEKAVLASTELFGELPYDQYWFMFDFGGSGGGLEHMDCFRIGFSPRTSAQQASGTIFHEYMHAFNVKRIRSKPLGPFDYSKPAITGAIWWLEGVTDYYASVLSVRAGLTTRDDFLKYAFRTYTSLHKNPNAFKISANESSLRVWEVQYSQGYGGLSYYQKGWNIGMALDLAIRCDTNGKKSLDDVIRRLYTETKSGPGFEEFRIRELCIEIGGGRLAEVYDASVMRPGVIPINESLSKLGMAMNETAIVEQENTLGKSWPFAVNGAR